MLGFECVAPMNTVHNLLKEKNCLNLLEDGLVSVATQEIIDDGKKTRSEIQRKIKEKEWAVEQLAYVLIFLFFYWSLMFVSLY